MAEFCLDCWNKLNHTHLTQEDVILSHDNWDLCEGCAQIKPVVIKLGKPKRSKRKASRRRNKRGAS